MNLIDLQKTFKTEDDALEYLTKLRWPEGVRCVTCGTDKVKQYVSPTKKQPSRKVYQCQEPTCKQQFTATAGTIFHDTHLPMTKWFMALSLLVDAKKSVSAKQLERHLGCSYKAAWYLAHRIRKAMEETGAPLTGTVEIDETYVGGKSIRRSNRGNRKYEMKDAVVGMVERGGRLRFRYIGKGSATADRVRKVVLENVSRDVERVVTDESVIYPRVFDGFCASKHETVCHRDEYVRGVDTHTNTIESAFSLLKRGIMGSFHHVSIKHLPRYCSEFEYRFNRREQANSFEETLGRMVRVKPMPFETLTADE
jgi:hypothetical protein